MYKRRPSLVVSHTHTHTPKVVILTTLLSTLSRLGRAKWVVSRAPKMHSCIFSPGSFARQALAHCLRSSLPLMGGNSQRAHYLCSP